MKAQTSRKRKPRKWLKKAGIILVVLLLAPAFLFTLGWFNRDFLIDELQEWYSANNNGSLEIGQVDATFLEGFPNVGFTINDIYQSSFDTILDKRSSISIKEARVSIGARDLMIGNLEFKNIEIYNAEIYSEVITDKSLEQYIRLKEGKQQDPNYGLKLPSWLDTERNNFKLNEITFISKDSMLNKYFNLKVHDANGQIRTEQGKITGNLDFKIMVNNLGFNTKKGTFINGALITGSPGFELNQAQDLLTISDFPLQIGEQTFNTNAEFDFNGINGYKFSLKNPETNFRQTRGLLADSIAAKLAVYEIEDPLETSLRLEGKFQYGDVPYIDADYIIRNSNIKVGDEIQLSAVDIEGHLTNSLTEAAELRKKQPGQVDIRIFFKELKANLEDIEIKATDSYYQSSKDAMNFVQANLKMSGSNETLAKALNTVNFNFIGGNFNLETQIKGDIPNPVEIFNNSNGRFSIRNTRVVLRKNELQLPVEALDVTLKDKNSILEQLKINLPNGENLIFSGTVDNFASILVNNPATPASTDVSLDSKELNLNNLINTAMEFIPPSKEKTKNLNTLHETFEAIYRKFQPRFRLDLNTVIYNEVRFNDLDADLYFLNSETLQLKNLSFNYDNALTQLQGTLKVPESTTQVQQPIFLNVEALSSGPLALFQELFNIELLDINDGDFNFTGNITGNINHFEQLMSNATGNLKLTNSKFYYPKADIDIALDSLEILVDESNISLKEFTVEIEDHHPFSLQFRVEKFPGVMLDDVKNKGKVFVELDAPFVDMKYWMQTVSSLENDSIKKTSKKRNLNAIFADIYKFDPEFKLEIDSLKSGDLVSRDISAKVYFQNDSLLKLDDLTIKYRNSEALIKGQLEAQNIQDSMNNQNPFNFEFSAEAHGDSQDLNELLQTVNFVIRSGKFNFNGSYKGQAQDLKILNTNARGDLRFGKTRVDIKGTDIQVPVDSLHLQIENNLASLEKLDIDLPGKSSIDITGKIDNFSDFINNTEEKETHNSSFRIRSPYLNSRDIKKFIGSRSKKKDTTKKQNFELQNLKDLLSNINRSYRPSAGIQIDSLIYNDLAVSDFNSKIDYINSGAIRIADTQLKYYEGHIELMIEAGVQDQENLPVKIKMNIADIELEKLVKDLHYFNNEDLREAEKITGNLDLEVDITGILNNKGSLDMNSLNGTLAIDLQNLALYKFDPIIESVVLLKEERFEELQFRPIKQTLEVTNGRISIPRTQIQSSALHLFIEGESKIGEFHNVWISLPWNNILITRDGKELPEKISFEESGAKFYLQVIQDKENENPKKQKLKTKFRLGNRKLRKMKEKN